MRFHRAHENGGETRGDDLPCVLLETQHMSHFATLEVSYSQEQEAELVAALESLFGAGSVEVCDEPAGLFGYRGDDRSRLPVEDPGYAPACHIIVRRKHLGPGTNDIGFVRNESGGYVAYVSEFDKVRTFGSVKQGRLLQEYSLLVAEKKLRSDGYSTSREARENGVVQIIGTKW
jgi:hypothetical protein